MIWIAERKSWRTSLNKLFTMVPGSFRSRGWEFLCERPITYPSVFIQEFFSNIHTIDTSVPHFTTLVRGTRIIVTSKLTSEVLHVPRVGNPDYPGSSVLRSLSQDALASHFCEHPSSQGSILSMVIYDFARDPRVFNMTMTFILTPCSHYNTITQVRAQFRYSLLEGPSMDIPSHMSLSMLDMFHDTTSHDKLIFPSFITRILLHAHVSILSSSHFYVMSVIRKESLVRSSSQLVAKTKRPRDDATLAQREETKSRVAEDSVYTSRHSSSSTPPSSSSRVEATFAAILDQFQFVCGDIGDIKKTQAFCGDLQDCLTNEMCQMNTRIERIAPHQSRLCGFVPSPKRDSLDAVFASGDDDDASNSSEDDMTTSQLSTFVHRDKNGKQYKSR